MPPACDLLGMAAPAPQEGQPFRFVDLPTEIRYMVHELLMDKRVRVRGPEVKLSRHIGCRGSSYVDCYHPATMRVNKQVRYEYMTIVMPRMMLCVNWWIRARRTMFFFKPSDLSYPILPMTIFSQLRFLHLDAVIYSSFPSQSPYLDFSVMKLSTDSTRRPFKCSISLLRSHTSNAPAKLLFVHHEILAGR
jgi:hypothetical protein